MKTINADELIKALEEECDAVQKKHDNTLVYAGAVAWRNYTDGLQTAIDTIRKLAEQTDNVGELPY